MWEELVALFRIHWILVMANQSFFDTI
uniref:Uncharacterized protein n=1 Tax=Rhizophora mucronata TaxID=61149 RepID=A0A2P2QPA0_RHIMU